MTPPLWQRIRPIEWAAAALVLMLRRNTPPVIRVDGTGEAGVFRLEDGSQVLRFENFDIENGPDLEVYLVPGADRTSLADGAIHLGPLQGNVGDQTYEIPGAGVPPGPWTALVWCEAFSVEFVGATISVAG